MSWTFLSGICVCVWWSRTALGVGGYAVGFAVLLETQLQLMKVHWSGVDAGALQIHADTLTPLPPRGDSHFLKKEKGKT